MQDYPKDVKDAVLAMREGLVIGAGTMGSGIARLLVEHGFNVRVLDPFAKNLAKTCDRLKIPESQRFAELVPEALAGVDVVIEAASEDRAIKKEQVYARLGAIFEQGGVKDTAIIGSNTSSIPITELGESLPEALRPRFMGTHFFNPAHHMKLLELIPGAATAEATAASFHALGALRWEKEVARAADLPGFIVNRLLMFDYGQIFHAVADGRYTIEELDYVLGAPIGRPMGPFALGDLIGNDLFAPISEVIYGGCPEDPFRETFTSPAFLGRLCEKGYLGAKAGGVGFFKYAGRKPVAVFDPETAEHVELERPRFASVEEALKERDLFRRVLRLLASEHDDRGRAAARDFLLPLINYTRGLVGVIGEAPDIETAMVYGLNHRVGPLGLADSPYGPELLAISKALHEATGDRRFAVVE